jgi:PAS domain S-box-containing protein
MEGMGSRELAQKDQAYFEESPVGMFVVNETGDYVDVNPAACELVGYSRDELLAMSIDDLNDSDKHPEEFQTFRALKESGESRTQVSLRHKDGHDIDVLFEAVALSEDRFVAYCQDITKQKEYETKLEEQRDTLKLVNQMLRHDIRNNLQSLTANAELVAEKTDSEEISDHAEMILETADHAVELTRTARQMADATFADEEELHPVGLRNVLQSVLEEVQSAYPEAVVSGERVIPAVTVRADDMLDSVFRNVLKNAIQHSDEEVPKVVVSSSERTETVEIRIADNGPGIADENKDVIFEKGETGLDSDGTGIGLYLTRKLVENYGGDIRVTDNDPKGTVFVIELPVSV